jgi:hypothetical protein
MLDCRDPKKEALSKWKAANPAVKSGSFANAAAFGNQVVLDTAGHGAIAGLPGRETEDMGSVEAARAIEPSGQMDREQGDGLWEYSNFTFFFWLGYIANRSGFWLSHFDWMKSASSFMRK